MCKSLETQCDAAERARHQSQRASSSSLGIVRSRRLVYLSEFLSGLQKNNFKR